MASRLTRVGAATIGAIVIVAAACSPGGQDEPDAIARRDVPFDLLDTTTTTTDPESVPGAEGSVLYFVVDDGLVPVTRPTGPPTADDVLDLLVDGPTADESLLGLTTAIPSGARIGGLTRHGNTLTIELATDPGSPASSAPLAVAQLVLTATAVPGIERVRFRVDGDLAQVPEADGTLTEGPVERSDYEVLVRR